MTTQKEQINELQARIERIEHKLWPKTEANINTTRIYSPGPETPVPETPLAELTAEEKAWLKSKGLPADSKQQFNIHLQQADMASSERKIINSLKKKRNIRTTWHT